MIKTIYICDRCKRESNDGEKFYDVDIRRRQAFSISHSILLCRKCSLEFDTWIHKGKKDNNDEPC
jgi:DNA-directed RNA polymerase subunit RPC12/RpoP